MAIGDFVRVKGGIRIVRVVDLDATLVIVADIKSGDLQVHAKSRLDTGRA